MLVGYRTVDDPVTRTCMERRSRNVWGEGRWRLHALRETRLWLLQDPEQGRVRYEVWN